MVSEFFARWLWFWTPIVSRIPDSLSCIPDSKAQDSQFLRQRFPGLRNPDFLKWSDPLVVTWSNLVPREGKKPWERGCTWSSSGDAVECLHEARVCIGIVLWLAHFAPHFSQEVGRRSWHHNVLLQLLSITASSDYIVGKPVNLFLLLLFYLPLRTTNLL